MKPVYPIKFLTILIVTLILIGINKNAADAADKQCWNLVDVKTEWKKRNADGEWIKVSPNGVKSHLSTDRSWQWIEYSDPLYPKGRLVVNAGWSPPPNQYCCPGQMGMSLKLTNKAINSKNKNTVAILSWGPDHRYGYKRRQVRIGGHEPGNSEKNTVRMANGQMSLSKPASWYASVDIGNLTGKISYHYLPVNLNRQTAPKAPVQTPHPPKASSPAPSVASLNANDDTFVRSLYYSILDRQPDKAGVRHWKQLLDQGQSRTWVITQFFKSFEYTNRHKNNTEYVRDLYQGVLGRQPDPGGLAHWVNRLNSGSSRQSVLNGFLNSKEYHSRTSKG